MATRPTWVMMPVLCAGFPGLIVPFVTTLLGVVAIGQIRRSDGKLYGMPLALFDALCFPLLLLDAVLLWLGLLLMVAIMLAVLQLPSNASLTALGPMLLTGLLVLPMVVVLDIWLIRLAWQAATKGMTEYAAGLPDFPEKKPLQEPPPFQPQGGRNVSTALLVTLAVLAVLAIPTVLAGGVLVAYFFSYSAPAPEATPAIYDHGSIDSHGHESIETQMTLPVPAMAKEPAAEH